MLLKDVIEALIFASQKPLSVKEMVAALRSAIDDSDSEEAVALSKMKEEDLVPVLEQLQFEYQQHQRAFHLVEQASGWTFVTKPQFGFWIRQLYPESKPTRLSGPALETLAIIAYRQPITKPDIEAVRGVSVDGVIASLLERGLIRIAGRADLPGRPLLFETTQLFMDHFGLRKLDELPNSNELRRVALPTAADAKPAASGGEADTAPATAEEPAESAPAETTPPPPTEDGQPAPEPEPSPEPAEPVAEDDKPIFEFFGDNEEPETEPSPNA